MLILQNMNDNLDPSLKRAAQKDPVSSAHAHRTKTWDWRDSFPHSLAQPLLETPVPGQISEGKVFTPWLLPCSIQGLNPTLRIAPVRMSLAEVWVPAPLGSLC